MGLLRMVADCKQYPGNRRGRASRIPDNRESDKIHSHYSGTACHITIKLALFLLGDKETLLAQGVAEQIG
jgi:hypothetical protein